MKKFPKFLAAGAMALTVLAGCGSEGAGSTVELKDGDTVKVGLNYELSGSTATYGLAMDKGSKLAIKQYNENENSKYKIEVVSQDCKSDSTEAQSIASKLMTEEKAVKKDVKEKSYALHMKTKETIEGLSDEQALKLLRLKWIAPLCASLRAMPYAIIDTLEKSVQTLVDKYAVTYLELDEQIQKSEEALSSMIDELTGNEYDMKGLAEFKALMAGESDE